MLAAILLTAAACAGSGGGALQARFQAGNDAYERGDYLDAAEIYREIARDGLSSTALHYNLGNALFKSGNLGEAILHYERALLLDPGDEDARENLEYLRSLTVDEIVPADSPLDALGITFLLEMTTPDQDAFILVAAWMGTGLALGAGLLARSENGRRTAYYAAGAMALPVLLAGAALAAEAWIAASVEHGIVLASEAEVLSGAGEENPALFTVHEGLKVGIRGRAGDWVHVSLENGLSGWLPRETLEPI